MKLLAVVLMLTYSFACLADKQFNWGSDSRLTRLEYGIKKTCEKRGGILEREARLGDRVCSQVICQDKTAHVVCKSYSHAGRRIYNPSGLYVKDYGSKKYYNRLPASHDYAYDEEVYFYQYPANQYVGTSIRTSFNECVERYGDEARGRRKCGYLLQGLTYSQCTRFYSDVREGHVACRGNYYPHETIKATGRMPASADTNNVSNKAYYQRGWNDYPYYWSHDYYRAVDPEFVEIAQ